MNYLLDTNILLRLIETNSPQHQETVGAIKKLLTNQDDIHLIYESLIEFWVVATRAATSNGLGLPTSVADHHITNFLGTFILLPQSSLFDEWRNLVTSNSIAGYKSYDARFVAAAMVHEMNVILTYNKDDFKSYSGILVQSPADVLQQP